MDPIRLGVDQLLADRNSEFHKMSWGLVSNNASRTRGNSIARVALQKAGFCIKCLFSPEHGLSASEKDGAVQPDMEDPLTGLPVYSLYGQGFKPLEKMLKDLDGILFDLPDIGVRFYTYIWTMSHIMEACHETGKPLVILDRPNPLSGQLELSEGPMLDETELSSFIGRWSIPIRHSLTIGELGKFWKSERGFNNLDLTIIPCKGWARKQYFDETGLTFTPPSPAINFPETLLTYPAFCFFEGTNLSEGRGTEVPFQQFGAPWIDGAQLEELLNSINLPGVAFQATRFQPKNYRYSGKKCEGARLIITDRHAYRPVKTGIALMALMKLYFPEKFQWANYPTYANPSGERHVELLLGNSDLKKEIEERPAELLKNIEKKTEVTEWKEKARPFLIEDYLV